MTVRVESNWPLTVIDRPRDAVVKKSPFNDPAPSNTSDLATPDKTTRHESDCSWEKGAFIDIYI